MQFTTTIEIVPALSADMLDIPPAKLARPGYMRTIILAKIAALQSMLGEPVIVWNGPVRAPEKARKAAVRKPAALSGPEFWERASAAYAAVRREYGDAWRYHAPAVWRLCRLGCARSSRRVAWRCGICAITAFPRRSSGRAACCRKGRNIVRLSRSGIRDQRR